MTQEPIKLLDHGFIRLVDWMGTDLSVVRAARVSYDAAWRSGEDAGSDKRLINYLWKNKHTSPFESVTFTFEVKAPIFVFRQFMRHRTWSFNETSGRYCELPEEYYVPDLAHIGKQSKDNKQCRDMIDAYDVPNAHYVKNLLQDSAEESFKVYHKLIELNCPRELARIVLPLGTYSHMFASVDLLNLLKFISLRDHAYAQYEIQVYAKAMLELIKPIVPACVEVFEQNRGSHAS